MQISNPANISKHNSNHIKFINSIDDAKFVDGVHIIVAKNLNDLQIATMKIVGTFHNHHGMHNYNDLVLNNFGHDMYYADIQSRMEALQDSRQQIFITTMNPFVINFLKIFSLEDVFRIIIATGGHLRNVTNPKQFYSKYQAGIMHVSEILISTAEW